MSAFVTFKSNFTFEFHTGSDVKRRLRNPLDWLDIVSIQCDGHELEQACEIIGRNTTRKIFTFIGQEAQTIFVNFK